MVSEEMVVWALNTALAKASVSARSGIAGELARRITKVMAVDKLTKERSLDGGQDTSGFCPNTPTCGTLPNLFACTTATMQTQEHLLPE